MAQKQIVVTCSDDFKKFVDKQGVDFIGEGVTKKTGATQIEICDAAAAFIDAHRWGSKLERARSCKPVTRWVSDPDGGEGWEDYVTDDNGEIVMESVPTPDYDADGNPVMITVPVDLWALEMARTLACREVGGSARTVNKVKSLEAQLAEMTAKLAALGVTA